MKKPKKTMKTNRDKPLSALAFLLVLGPQACHTAYVFPDLDGSGWPPWAFAAGSGLATCLLALRGMRLAALLHVCLLFAHNVACVAWPHGDYALATSTLVLAIPAYCLGNSAAGWGAWTAGGKKQERPQAKEKHAACPLPNENHAGG